ncbi:MAG: hypothetical protein Q7S27_02390 [Nanoarchaeota archaeon]|nr:hypothetical protein [Nanoarchaeota archaeon]
MKRGMLFLGIFLICLVRVQALGISPAITEIDFVPGQEYEFTFSVISESPDQIVEVKVGGDLVEYVKLSDDEVEGGGSFNLKLKLPVKAPRPGPNRISIILSEKKSEEKFIGTKIEIRGTIIVKVPYPGRYLEADFNLGDGNVDSSILVGVDLFNRGKESLYVNSKVEFYEIGGDQSVHFMPFSPNMLEAGQSKNMQKVLNTSGMKPGNYIGKLTLDYGESLVINRSFRIGYLFIKINNFTNELPRKDIQKFFIGIESQWNGQINNIYADVNISNSTKNIAFRTPSITLEPWHTGLLEGFIDTRDLNGAYDLNIVLNYMDQKTYGTGTLKIIEQDYNLGFIALIGGIAIIIVLLIIYFIWKSLRGKNSNGKRKR